MEIHEGPTCLMGDFNAIASIAEKWRGNTTLSVNNREFRQWMHGSWLIDMGYQGPAYTWSNNQDGSALINERLNRVLVNLEWHKKFPIAYVFIFLDSRVIIFPSWFACSQPSTVSHLLLDVKVSGTWMRASNISVAIWSQRMSLNGMCCKAL